MTEYKPAPGDLVWTDLAPRLGREQAGRGPALIVSPTEFWRATRFVFLAPVAGRVRPFPSSVVLPSGLKVAGEVLLGQARSVDTLARPILFLGEAVGVEVLAEAREKLALLLGISR